MLGRNKLALFGVLFVAVLLFGQNGSTGRSTVQMYDGTNVIGTASHPVQVSLANTAANSTAVKVDNSAVTQPVSCSNCSGTVTVSGTVATTPPSNASTNIAQIGGTAVVADPCQANVKSYFATSGTASVKIITGTAAKKTYICSINVVVGAAQNVAIVEGTGTTCATSTVTYPGLSGGTTAAGGWNFAANGGIAYGNGSAAVGQATTAADDVCAFVANAVQTNVSGTYVQQ